MKKITKAGISVFYQIFGSILMIFKPNFDAFTDGPIYKAVAIS